uniref:Taste receptor type 2 n=1 Tax=Oryctolagus cuniculus TaxID=9986 RepID=A0A5F9DRI1_RABIT
MTSLIVSILSIPVMVEFVLGNFANAFIALVNCIDWLKRKKLTSADGILTALAISRIALLCVVLMYFESIVFNPTSYSGQIRIAIMIAWAIAHHFSSWFATILSIFYLLKIANLSNFFFLYLKKHINSVILLVLLGSLLFLFCHIISMNAKAVVLINENEENLTWKSNFTDIIHLSNVQVLTVTNLVPFITSLLCLLLLIHSLYKHLKKIQLNGKGSQDLSTKVHVKAMQMVVSFLLLFALYFLFVTATIWNFNGLHTKPLLLLCHAFAFIFPSSHSFLLILVNRKLNQAFLLMLGQVRCRLKKWNPSNL